LGRKKQTDNRRVSPKNKKPIVGKSAAGSESRRCGHEPS
jgi:hypothetical protein